MPTSKNIEQMITGRVFARFGTTSVTAAGCRKLLELTEQIAAMERVAAKRSPLETEASHMSRIDAAAKRLSARATGAERDIREAVASARASLREQIREKSKLTPGENAQEIRIVLRGMTSQERAEVLADAAENRKSDILAAVAGADTLLTGLPTEMRDRHIHAYERQTCPDLHAELEALDGFESGLAPVLELVQMTITGAVDPQAVRRNDELAADAAAAQRDLEKSFQAA